jgi:hypothetical protein
MATCQISWREENYASIEGDVGNNSNFDEIFTKVLPDIWVDLGGVSRMNSLGVHEWVKSVSKFGGAIHYVNVPMCVLEQFSVVREFSGKNADVASFWAQYACEHCRAEENVLLLVGKDIQPGLAEYEDGPLRKCPSCGHDMFFGHDPDTALAWLTKMPMPLEYK